LAKEGVIYPNSHESLGITKSDMQKRQNLEQQKMQKLKLLHYFVSPTRLTVHNIPKNVSDDELKLVFSKAIGARRGDLIKCRIMRDLARVSADGVARSKGFGFVEFKNFTIAKRALHETNNNPNLFEKNNTRLIVQFSVENVNAIKKQQQRVVKSRVRQQNNANRMDSMTATMMKPSSAVPTPTTTTTAAATATTTAKSKKKGFDIPISTLDDTESNNRIRQRNLMKVDSLEKKLAKKKEDEEAKGVRKVARAEHTEQKIVAKEARLNELSAKLEVIKKEKRQSKKDRQKAKKAFTALTNKKKKRNQYDDVDQLVERYQSKHLVSAQ
jgi:RNA recognition motif-containing protein